MTDLEDHLDGTGREVRSDDAGHAVVLRRTYPAPVEDVWDACTDPDRISRWFLPVKADPRVGGRYQIEGNAGGEVRRCEPPRLLVVSWVFGDQESEVEVRLGPDDAGTLVEVEHRGLVDSDFWTEYGPGAVGVGWDLILLGLGMYLRTGASVEDPVGWQASPEARDFMTRSATAWGAAHQAAGASPEAATAAAAHTTNFYAPPPPTER